VGLGVGFGVGVGVGAGVSVGEDRGAEVGLAFGLERTRARINLVEDAVYSPYAISTPVG